VRSFVVVVVAACSHPVVFHDGRADPSMARTADPSLDASALDRLLVTAAAEHSSAVVIAQDGRIVVERYREGYDGTPVMAMSASKSIVAISAGLAINDGKLALDTPVAALVPEWHDDGKRAITVRHLLSQTSGLETSRAQFRDGETIVAHSAAARVVFAPGSHWQYNNGGVDLLAAVIERAVGEPFDRYVERALFAKLGIRDASWLKDRAGTARGAGELMIRPVDLIKLGELMLDQGRWHDQPVVPPEWVTAMERARRERARRLARRSRARDHDRTGEEPARSPVRNACDLSSRARRVARPVCVRGAQCDHEAQQPRGPRRSRSERPLGDRVLGSRLARSVSRRRPQQAHRRRANASRDACRPQRTSRG
jgi:CubicO group peptidase (beta-lactamase class C family)